jgi:predicted lipid-binding transport protein (Tim44 family)
MHYLFYGIFGLVSGLILMVCGGGFIERGGSYQCIAYLAFFFGLALFIVGVPCLILGIMQLVSDARDGGKRRKRPKDRTAIPSAKKSEIAEKAAATKELLRRLSAEDDWFEPKHLKEVVEEVFTLFQEAWEHGDFGRLGKYVLHDCIDKYLDRYENDIKRLKMAKLDDVDLDRIQFVYVAAVGKLEKHLFTAYLEASGADNFKEYWTFCRTAKRWKLEKMQAASVSEAVVKLNDIPPEMIAALEAEEDTEDLLKFVSRV